MSFEYRIPILGAIPSDDSVQSSELESPFDASVINCCLDMGGVTLVIAVVYGWTGANKGSPEAARNG